jgi:CDP-diacylglycerol--glycerol-3-phosphate 3-phosphatidyltransferase/archaetidylinositol phosphate synthase
MEVNNKVDYGRLAALTNPCWGAYYQTCNATIGGRLPAINSRIRRNYEALMMPAGAFLSRLRVTPNTVSFASLVFAGFASAAFSLRRLGLGVAMLVASIFVDMLDGSIARASGRVTSFGRVVDHTADRYAEFLYVFGLCYGGYAPFWLGFLCYFSMLMPSYVRAKVESSGRGLSCQGVGIAERKEKLGILLLALILEFFVKGAVVYGLAAITVISQVSTLQRLHHASGGGGSGESTGLD